jgi:hypothetical protein
MRLLLSAAALFVAAPSLYPQSKSLALSAGDGLTLHNAIATPVTFQGKKAIKLTSSSSGPETTRQDHLALLDGLDFASGTIEVDLAGEPGPGAAAGGARGFVGVAFRVQSNRKTYDCFYVRPTNGRVDDQERRNHTAQYIQHPNFPWFTLRKETPSKYESYVDLVTGAWTKIKIEVRGSVARLFVHDSDQPALIVNDVKSGAQAKGGVGLWLDIGTVAHFRNLTVTAK